MNEILARAASRRISTRRTPSPAPTTTSTTTSTRSASSPSGPRRTTPRHIIAGQATSKPAGNTTPLRAIADASQPTPPTADVLDNDRILELPTRAPKGIIRPADARPAAMASIRELAPTYAAQAGQRRSTQAVSPMVSSVAPAPADAPTERARNDVSSAVGATNPANATSPSAQRGRVSRAAGNKASASGVCPLCHGAGYVRLDVPMGDPAFGQAVRCQCKERQIEERDRLNLRSVSNLDPFRDKTFESFDVALPNMREPVDIARHYADDPLGWLVFRGGYGCGKTHLAAAIANVAEQSGQRVVFAIVPDLLDHLRATFAPNSDVAYDALFEKVRESALLVLDDFGAENSTAWATEKLFQLINYRYNYRMPTVITTNHRLLAHMDERIRSRLSDLGLVRHVAIEAADYRERHTGRPPRGASRGRPR